MSIDLLIGFTSGLVWIFPVLKQQKTRYFNYFFLLMLTSGSGVFLQLIHFYPTYFFPGFIILALATLIRNKLKFLFYALGIAAMIYVPIFNISFPVFLWISAATLMATFILILSDLLQTMAKTMSVNIFLVLLSLNALIEVLKFFDIALSLENGSTYYTMGELLSIVLAVVFCFININSKSFPIGIKAVEEE